MKKLTNLVAKALLFTVVVVGCSKDDPAPIICYVATLSETSGGNTYLTTFSYNSANRVVTMSSTGGGSSSNATYTYDSKNNLTSSTYTSSGGSAISYTYTYDANNRLTGSVANSGGTVSTTTYTYNSSGQWTAMSSSFSGGSSSYTLSYPNTTTRNNNSATSTSTFDFGSGPSTFTSTTTYEYDDKINPRRFLEQPSLQTDNNVTKMTVTSGGNVQITTKSYVYNDQGYPTTETSISGSDSSTQTATYTCK